jgi:WhiB family redox-sensing transcriptional regulator
VINRTTERPAQALTTGGSGVGRNLHDCETIIRGSLDMTNAPCRETDPEVFFPEPYDPDLRIKRDTALGLCARCPVLTECLTLRFDEPYGIVGGTTTQHRKAIKARINAGAVTIEQVVQLVADYGGAATVERLAHLPTAPASSRARARADRMARVDQLDVWDDDRGRWTRSSSDIAQAAGVDVRSVTRRRAQRREHATEQLAPAS